MIMILSAVLSCVCLLSHLALPLTVFLVVILPHAFFQLCLYVSWRYTACVFVTLDSIDYPQIILLSPTLKKIIEIVRAL